ncbi:DUF5085 family protein [Paenibacillus hexagrammi]|uniref:DUF5085 family protein n=1 Tax=Paenibacillus hexagrammi TaxID=2908839 RepID=A0ABY3SM80_9BACL|nr:DUF5085 family protein [Paenibacillus sp. YPD9-1]UJF34225.1 DUF5085 family protein [Paenibacillus sp. YPD9-1]
MIKTNSILIEQGKQLQFHNVASFRKKMRQQDVQRELEAFMQMLKHRGLSKNGPMITATYGAELVNGEQWIDMEFLLPVSGSFEPLDCYQFRSEFSIVSALYTRHTGGHMDIHQTYAKLVDFIQVNQLNPIRVSYHVSVNENDMVMGENPS